MLKLPHPELYSVLESIKANTITRKHSLIMGNELSYTVYRSDPDIQDLRAIYDEQCAIYVDEKVVELDERFADLTAYHELLEIRHKLAGRSHAYSHRRAYVEELLTAKGILPDSSELRRYLQWRIEGYPAWKQLKPEEVVTELLDVLTPDKPRKGELLRVITMHSL